ncbi:MULTISPECIES: inositol monophosphatase family protein [unclassified Arthrobacter]|uniref:inositol monophosphatase family protein n=2 Tax=Arthrobacter TaxID=1663 RepID=UPI001E463414|nr:MULTISPECIES: inositol monophosphatase family protein [unclassified Arthrobacter]MCC9146185.1 inositol monophosphatase [Arthrobacter sp. zg-Y919]MDK1277415.1 inositol monophosphatase family protein [Arthrobacter sp. zg.Y919]
MMPLPDAADPLELLEVAREAAAAGAAVLAQRSTGGLNAVNKSADGDWVTDFDTAAEVAVREVLARLRPHDVVMGEELEPAVPVHPSGIRWSIDPLDGTTNFIRDIVYYGTSVAAVNDDGEWLAGVVHAPALVRVYSAARGHGAWLAAHGNVRKLTGPDPQRVGKVLGTGFSYDAGVRAEQYAALPDLAGNFADVRRLGSAALDLCMVADGTLDAYIERGLNEYDYAAGALIAEEAGVRVQRPPQPANDAERLDAVTAAGIVLPE